MFFQSQYFDVFVLIDYFEKHCTMKLESDNAKQAVAETKIEKMQVLEENNDNKLEVPQEPVTECKNFADELEADSVFQVKSLILIQNAFETEVKVIDLVNDQMSEQLVEKEVTVSPFVAVETEQVLIVENEFDLESFQSTSKQLDQELNEENTAILSDFKSEGNKELETIEPFTEISNVNTIEIDNNSAASVKENEFEIVGLHKSNKKEDVEINNMENIEPNNSNEVDRISLCSAEASSSKNTHKSHKKKHKKLN